MALYREVDSELETSEQVNDNPPAPVWGPTMDPAKIHSSVTLLDTLVRLPILRVRDPTRAESEYVTTIPL